MLFVNIFNKGFLQWKRKQYYWVQQGFGAAFTIKALSVKNTYLGCLYYGVVLLHRARALFFFFFLAILLLAFFAADFRRIILSASCQL